MQGCTKNIFWLLLLLLSTSSSSFFGHGSDSDVQCLKDLKRSLFDPNGILEYSWNFTRLGGPGDIGSSHANYSICDFNGVGCWTSGENKILGLYLGNLGLEGPFPAGLELCTSMTTLDLSDNKFSGPLPERISDQLYYLTNLDLSNNSFSGEIPAGIANMTYLNVLALQHNQFEGQIPAQLTNLSRLVSFSVADNSLSGPVPDSLQSFPSANFTGNPGLCGPPLDNKCKKRFRVRIRIRPIRIRVRLRRINDASSIGAAAGFVRGVRRGILLPAQVLVLYEIPSLRLSSVRLETCLPKYSTVFCS